MTIEEFDAKNTQGTMWVKDEANAFSYMWTGWKRKYDPRLFMSNDPTIPTDPIDDTLVGQWIGQCDKSFFYYASVPGGDRMSREGCVLDCEVKPAQTALTINSSPDLLEHCRKEGFARLITTMGKMGAIDGPNFPA